MGMGPLSSLLIHARGMLLLVAPLAGCLLLLASLLKLPILTGSSGSLGSLGRLLGLRVWL